MLSEQIRERHMAIMRTIIRVLGLYVALTILASAFLSEILTSWEEICLRLVILGFVYMLSIFFRRRNSDEKMTEI